MSDYEHSSNYHKIASKINETNNLKDLDTMKKKLGELEQDDEVRELLAKCEERKKEIEELIKEEKYKKAVSEYDIEGSDIESQINSFQYIKDYRDSKTYLNSLTTEKEYRFLVNSFNSGNCNWESVCAGFKALGEYKKSQEYFNACQMKAEEQRKKRVLEEEKKKEAELESKYKEACNQKDNGNYQYASIKFKELGKYKDSEQKAEECDKKLAEKEAAEKNKKRIVLFVFLALIVLGLGAYLIVNLITWKADDSGHWHEVLGSQIAYAEHDWNLTREELPTCNYSGLREYECGTCGETRQEYIRPLEHAFDSGMVTKEPTCTEKGIKTFTCTTCGAVKTESIDMKPHSFVDTIRVQPQCETRGLADSKCSVCGFTTTWTLDATGHDWKSVSKRNPTCTVSGSESFACSSCGKTKVEVIPAIEHQWVISKTVNPTCVSDGYKEYRCSVCGKTIRETVDATGHNYLDGFCLDCGFDRNQYHVGDVGPAGGYIFYDCDADNAAGNADGLISTEEGWRYLEAAPADLRVVYGVPTVDKTVNGYSDALNYYIFGYYRNSDSGSNLYVNGKTTYNAADCTGTAIGPGKTNTRLLVDAMGSKAYTDSSGSSKTSNYASRLCDILTYTENGVTYDDWFLPSKDELNQMYVNLKKNGLGGFADNYYWSSSENNNNPNSAWRQSFNNGNQNNYSRNDNDRVRPVRAF